MLKGHRNAKRTIMNNITKYTGHKYPVLFIIIWPSVLLLNGDLYKCATPTFNVCIQMTAAILNLSVTSRVYMYAVCMDVCMDVCLNGCVFQWMYVGMQVC